MRTAGAPAAGGTTDVDGRGTVVGAMVGAGVVGGAVVGGTVVLVTETVVAVVGGAAAVVGAGALVAADPLLVPTEADWSPPQAPATVLSTTSRTTTIGRRVNTRSQ
jgi:hypothetical protein